MRGYPKHIGNKQDFDNLLSMPEFRDRAMADLKQLKSHIETNAKVTKVISGDAEKGDLVTEQIDHPSPRHVRMGFKDAADLDGLIAKYEKEVVIDVK